MNRDLTYKRAKELFGYDPKTGNLIWLITKQGRAKKGTAAGSLNGRGYYQTMVDGTLYYNHRIVWLWHKGYIPEHLVDHINRVSTDNRIENLREVSYKCNLRNAGNRKHNKSGVNGVVQIDGTNKWKSHITNNGKTIHLGHYNKFHNAVCARLAAEQCLDWGGCNSETPAYKYVQKNIVRPQRANHLRARARRTETQLSLFAQAG